MWKKVIWNAGGTEMEGNNSSNKRKVYIALFSGCKEEV